MKMKKTDITLTKPRKIGSALKMQEQLEALFFKAIDEGNIKAAGYIGQIWVSCESFAKEERANKKQSKTAIDDLCKILDKARKSRELKDKDNEEKENEE